MEPLARHAFEPFLTAWTAQGYYLGIDTWLRIYRWLDLRQEQEPTARHEPADVCAALSAMICHSATEQVRFRQLFEQYFGPAAEGGLPVPDPGSETPTALPPLPVPAVPEPPTPAGEMTATAGEPPRYSGPFRLTLRLPTPSLRIWNHPAMDRAALPLREKIWADTYDWDIPRSIGHTIRSGGVPQFVYRRRKRAPQYLVLVAQQSRQDHLAAFYRELVLEMNRRDLEADCYYYDTTPDIVWKDRESMHPGQPIERLAGDYPDAAVLWVDTADQLLDRPALRPSPLAIRMQEWWTRLALLETSPVTHWGAACWALCPCFPVVPATAEGLASLVPQWASRHYRTPLYWQQAHPEPSMPSLRRRGREVPADLLPALRRYLGADGFHWLCAIAWYADLHVSLSLLLHQAVLPPTADRSAWERQRRHWLAFHRLSRLPWLRKGPLPREIREVLRHQLPETAAAAVRAQLLQVMEHSSQHVQSGSLAESNRLFTIAWLKSEQSGLPITDHIPGDVTIEPAGITDSLGRRVWQAELAGRPMAAGTSPPAGTDAQVSAATGDSPADPEDSPDHLSLLRNISHFQEALHWMQQWETGSGPQADVSVWNALMEKADHAEAQLTVLGAMARAGVGPDGDTLRAALQAAREIDPVMPAVEQLLLAGISLTGVATDLLLARTTGYEEAYRLFHHLFKRSGQRPGIEAYTVLLKRTDNEREARSLLAEMQQQGIRPDPIFYTVLITKTENYRRARGILREMQQQGIRPDPAVYTTLFSRTETFAQAQDLFLDLRKAGIRPNRGLYAQILRTVTEAGQADWVADQMRLAGLGEGTIADTLAAGRPRKSPKPPRKK